MVVKFFSSVLTPSAFDILKRELGVALKKDVGIEVREIFKEERKRTA